ncbi:nicotinamide mononucleotide transporter PnuC [Clostridium sp. CAG:594]|nr:nicotinamide mononucleotide transporter PnuC [Clostridium sp. CAG:594]
MKNRKNMIVIIVSAIISIIIGIISKNAIIGSLILFTSIMNSYLASIGKKESYITGLISSILTSYVSLKNNLYGLFFFYLVIFAPMQVYGYINWKNNEDDSKNVKIRAFTLKNSLIIIFACIIGSFLLGYLLTLIPNQKLAFLDASSNIINLCAVILMILRFNESWWIWLFNNIIDLIIWSVTFKNNGMAAFSMFTSSLIYLIINVYGIIKWNKKLKDDKKLTQK